MKGPQKVKGTNFHHGSCAYWLRFVIKFKFVHKFMNIFRFEKEFDAHF